MKANSVLLQRKYTRIVEKLAQRQGLNLDMALALFMHSKTFELMREGVGDSHCLADDYLVEDICREQLDFSDFTEFGKGEK